MTQGEVRSYEKHAIELLRSHGMRVTMSRIQVVRALAKSQTPLSAYGVHEQILASGGRIDMVSVYRILSALQDVGLVHHIGVVQGYFACRMAGQHSGTSEHLICQSCGAVAEVDVPKSTLRSTREQSAALGFEPLNVQIEIVGRCQACRKTGAP